tara:strand:+ start:157 stop:1314 length:1158 start_codon:yes stop_codon:yes gene_type:complete
MIEYKVLKNNITIVLNEEWNSSNEREGIPLLATEKRNNTYGPVRVSGKNIKFYNIKETDVNTTYDYLFLEGYDNSLNNHTEHTSYKNLKVNEVIIAHSGEYATADELKEWNTFLNKNNISYKEKKVVIPIDEYKEDTHGWKLFKYPFSALRFFCSTDNKTFVGNEYTIDDCIGVGFSEEQKPKVFNCLINSVRRGRFHLAKQLLQSSCLEYGTCYWKEMVYDNKKIPSYGKHWIDSKHKSNADRFKFQPQHSKNAYIELQCESHIEQNSTFVTEKASKAFMGLQFPFFLAQPNYYQYFRDWGFDMFDDIFDHSYDTLPIRTEKELYHKVDMIISQLEKACEWDLHEIYIHNKVRLLHNQQRLYELVHSNNNRESALFDFIFQKNL